MWSWGPTRPRGWGPADHKEKLTQPPLIPLCYNVGTLFNTYAIASVGSGYDPIGELPR